MFSEIFYLSIIKCPPLAARQVRRLIVNPAVSKDFAALLAGSSAGEDKRWLAAFADLLERMMALDPERRIAARDALRHPFIKWGHQKPAKA
jgi:serine/threonine protein kinase